MKTQILKLYVLLMIMIFAAISLKAEKNPNESIDGTKSAASVETLNSANAYTVKIFDSKGNIVFQESNTSVNNNETQHLGNLTEGYYTYHVIHGTEMVYRAIISTSDASGAAIDKLPGNASASIAQKDQVVLVRLLKDTNSRAKIEIRDESNQVVYSKRSKKDGCQRIKHDFSNLPQGKYYINVINKGVLVAQKLIVK